jgi:1,4-dihydroxy-2-naphthoyl-CoA hydrolase
MIFSASSRLGRLRAEPFPAIGSARRRAGVDLMSAPDRLAPRSVPLEETLDGMLGVQIEELSGHSVRATVPVTSRTCQRFGLVHGGTYSAVAEFLASEGTVAAVHPDGKLAVGTQNSTHFLRALTEGTIHAEGRPVHRGRSMWLWEVEFRDDAGRLTATSRVTLAVRPAPEGLPPPLEPSSQA